MRHHATNTRDAALRKLARINRWMIAGSVALTGVLSEVAAQAFPGKAKASTSSTTAKHPTARASHAVPKRPTPLAPPATTTTEAAPETVQEAPRSGEAPAESAQAPESAREPSAPREPAPESAPAPAPESAPAPEPAPQQESSAPVISGGS
jgi:hypothetical protein